MNPRARKFLFDVGVAVTLIAAVVMARSAYMQAASQPRIDRGGRATNYAAPPPQLHSACPFAIAGECRKPELWPE